MPIRRIDECVGMIIDDFIARASTMRSNIGEPFPEEFARTLKELKDEIVENIRAEIQTALEGSSYHQNPARLSVVGDIHGSPNSCRTFNILGDVDGGGNWSAAGKTALQLGDIVVRGLSSISQFFYALGLQKQAELREDGSALKILYGNYEQILMLYTRVQKGLEDNVSGGNPKYANFAKILGFFIRDCILRGKIQYAYADPATNHIWFHGELNNNVHKLLLLSMLKTEKYASRCQREIQLLECLENSKVHSSLLYKIREDMGITAQEFADFINSKFLSDVQKGKVRDDDPSNYLLFLDYPKEWRPADITTKTREHFERTGQRLLIGPVASRQKSVGSRTVEPRGVPHTPYDSTTRPKTYKMYQGGGHTAICGKGFEPIEGRVDLQGQGYAQLVRHNEYLDVNLNQGIAAGIQMSENSSTEVYLPEYQFKDPTKPKTSEMTPYHPENSRSRTFVGEYKKGKTTDCENIQILIFGLEEASKALDKKYKPGEAVEARTYLSEQLKEAWELLWSKHADTRQQPGQQLDAQQTQQ